MTDRKKLIEVALPLDAINAAAAREKSIRHGHPSTLHLWWARRPLAACRAVLFAQLVDDPSGLPDEFPSEEAQEAERQRLFGIITALVQWENSTKRSVLEAARREIARSVARNAAVPLPETPAEAERVLKEHAPPVLDPFCGGGSIPLEAQRLGLEAHGSDLNPVAVLITKALIEIPPKFAGKPPVNPEARASAYSDSGWTGAKGLAADVRYYGAWMRDEAYKRIGHLYPKVSLSGANPGTADVWPAPSPETGDAPAIGAGRERKMPGNAVDWERASSPPRDWERGLPARPGVCQPAHPPSPQGDNIAAPPTRSAGVSPSPQGEATATVIAWLWARTVTCPNPACGATMPLVRSFWLSTKAGKKAWVEPVVDRAAKTISFEVKTGQGTPPDGTVNRLGARCIVCGTAVPFSHVRAEGKAGRMGARMMAIVAEGQRGRIYLPPSQEHEEIAARARPEWAPETDLPEQALGFRVQAYGLTRHADLFTPRQLVALTAFSDLVAEARERACQDAVAAGLPDDGVPLAECGHGAMAYADAISTYLGLAISKSSDYWSNLCIWRSDPKNLGIGHVFARQAVQMVWDYAEANLFSESSGNWTNNVEWTAKAEESLYSANSGCAEQLDATVSVGTATTCPLISTDPPYYDNIGYSDLSDFFYVWLRHSLKSIFPSLFRTLLTPKSQELIATPDRFEGDRKKAQDFFEQGSRKAFGLMRETQNPAYPLAVYYAFKQSEAGDDAQEADARAQAMASTGWETMLEGLIDAGFAVTGTWPMRTELGNRIRNIGSNALASSIVLVCRPRAADAPMAARRDFIAALRRELPDALKKLQHGNVAPVDLAQAAIGPGMAVFSRYSRVLEADGKPMPVRTALQLINGELDAYLSAQEGETDPETRFCLAWFEQYGMRAAKFGEADVLARAKNTSVDGLRRAGVLDAAGGEVRLRPRAAMDHDPAAHGHPPGNERRSTDWECAQRLILALHGPDGEAGAARVAAGLGAERAQVARDLAYRLYAICERKGWADEALAYNALVASWQAIQRKAAEVGTGEARQGTLTFE